MFRWFHSKCTIVILNDLTFLTLLERTICIQLNDHVSEQKVESKPWRVTISAKVLSLWAMGWSQNDQASLRKEQTERRKCWWLCCYYSWSRRSLRVFLAFYPVYWETVSSAIVTTILGRWWTSWLYWMGQSTSSFTVPCPDNSVPPLDSCSNLESWRNGNLRPSRPMFKVPTYDAGWKV